MAFEDGQGGGAGDGQGGGSADLLGGAAGGEGGGVAGKQGGADDGGNGGESGGGDEGGFKAPDWFDKLSAQAAEGETASNRDWAAAAGVKDLDGLVKIARDNMRAAREKGGIKVPGEGAKPEEITAFRTAIGVPEKPDGYEIKPIANGSFDSSRPESADNPKNIPLNEPLIAALRESAIKHGTPKGAFEGLVADFIGKQLDEANAERQTLDGQAADWLKEQGGNKAAQLAHVDAAARGLGFSRADMQWFRTMPGGAGRALGMLAKLGLGMAEDTLLTGGKGRFGVSGAEAKSEMDRLRGDAEFQKKVMVPGSAERQRWDRLNQAASEWQAAQDANP